MIIGVLALQGGVAEHERVLESLGAEVRKVRRPAHLEGLDGIVLPGGESTTQSKLLRMEGLDGPLADAIAGGLPAYGTCAGMILLASTVLDTREDAVRLGALDAVVRRNAFGRQIDSFEEDLDFAGIDDPVHAVFIRAPQVEEVGPDVEVLARTEGGAVVAVRQGRVMATSFHPECQDGELRVHELFLRECVGAGA
ncbi:pyridoxal 5'-phosphate synthase glutaminase subunit PdxT [Corynebacterium sp. 335C]